MAGHIAMNALLCQGEGNSRPAQPRPLRRQQGLAGLGEMDSELVPVARPGGLHQGTHLTLKVE